MNGRTAALRSAMVLLALSISTGEIAGQAATRFNPPKRYYLALGDSLAFGFQFVKFNANFPSVPASTFSTGYVDDFSGMLQEIRPGIATLNYGCPGETSVDIHPRRVLLHGRWFPAARSLRWLAAVGCTRISPRPSRTSQSDHDQYRRERSQWLENVVR